MDRHELTTALEKIHVDPSAYSLDGGLPVEKYCLEDRPGEWAVYCSERGLRSGERVFASEDAAMRYLFELLRDDPTTRARSI
jgi:hypothetical protein